MRVTLAFDRTHYMKKDSKSDTFQADGDAESQGYYDPAANQSRSIVDSVCTFTQ
jgi:hypothetical protein